MAADNLAPNSLETYAQYDRAGRALQTSILDCNTSLARLRQCQRSFRKLVSGRRQSIVPSGALTSQLPSKR
jgi:hypothetical protein